MSDFRLATIYFSTAETGHNKDSHGHVSDHPELQIDLDAGWRLQEMTAAGSGYTTAGDINAWLVLKMAQTDSAVRPNRQKVVSLFLTSKGFGIRQKDDAGRYDTYPALDHYLALGWEPVSVLSLGFPSAAGTSVSAGWLVVLMEKL